jgi:anaerobic magnesium-protoporphyrin IX monomethyl ester cyclase
MRILLLSMPDSFEHTSTITMRMPNGAIGSLAGNVDAHHDPGAARRPENDRKARG